MYLTEDFTSFSSTVFQERFITGQVGFAVENLRKTQDFLSIFEIEGYIKLFAILAFLFAFLLLMRFIDWRPLKERLVFVLELLFDLRSIDRYLGPIALIVLFYSIYFMIFKSVITNNVKTSKIILNTSEIVEQIGDVLKTDKMVCWLENESEIEMARLSPSER